MAGPLQNMLYRRPVRNAIRALLGMQPRYGSGGVGEQRGRMRNAPAGSSQNSSSPAGAVPPAAPLSEVAVPASSFAQSTTDPVKTAAALAAPAPDAMAKAVGYTPTQEQDIDADVSAVMPPPAMPALDRYLKVAAEDSERNSATAAVSPAERARGGLFANLPATTPTPATTAIGVAADPRAETIRQEREQTLARATAKRKAAEGLPAAPAPQAVGQPAAQRNPEAPRSSAPADPFAARQAQADDLRAKAQAAYEEAQAAARAYGSLTDPLQQATAIANQQMAFNKYTGLMGQASQIEDRIAYERNFAAQNENERYKVDRTNPVDDASTNAAMVNDLVGKYGIEGAVAATIGQYRSSQIGAAAADAEVLAMEKRVRAIATPAGLAQRIRAGGAIQSADDPVIGSLDSYLQAAAPNNPRQQQQLLTNVVHDAMIQLKGSPDKAAAYAAALMPLIQQRRAGY